MYHVKSAFYINKCVVNLGLPKHKTPVTMFLFLAHRDFHQTVIRSDMTQHDLS